MNVPRRLQNTIYAKTPPQSAAVNGFSQNKMKLAPETLYAP